MRARLFMPWTRQFIRSMLPQSDRLACSAISSRREPVRRNHRRWVARFRKSCIRQGQCGWLRQSRPSWPPAWHCHPRFNAIDRYEYRGVAPIWISCSWRCRLCAGLPRIFRWRVNCAGSPAKDRPTGDYWPRVPPHCPLSLQVVCMSKTASSPVAHLIERYL